jgi:site-specific DNA recombinase
MPNTQDKIVQKTAELVAKLQASFGVKKSGDGEQNPDLKYVIYARKSTDATEKQERSIGDKIGECKAFTERLRLRWVGVIHEEKSAKVSDKRVRFREMINGIKAGKYQAVLTWAPDRLSRNMKEAGEIIDLLDRGEIKDFKFSNGFTYNNDPAGKMLLGIAFVMAKQYSDQHSANITRTNRNKTKEGRYAGSRGKHGYYKDKNGYL